MTELFRDASVLRGRTSLVAGMLPERPAIVLHVGSRFVPRGSICTRTHAHTPSLSCLPHCVHFLPFCMSLTRCRYTVVGVAGERAPRAIVPSHVILDGYEAHIADVAAPHPYFAPDDVHLDAVVAFLHSLLADALLLKAHDRRVVVVEDRTMPSRLKQALADALFLHYRVCVRGWWFVFAICDVVLLNRRSPSFSCPWKKPCSMRMVWTRHSSSMWVWQTLGYIRYLQTISLFVHSRRGSKEPTTFSSNETFFTIKFDSSQ